ncbi:MAG TPA: phosphatase PAP2 family protein [Hanamia sp.]|nr:phosphatase PAP2 family protein [Hanamia sp.]
MTYSDHFIINVLHQISANCPSLNGFMFFLSNDDFLASGIVVSVFWFYWFQQDKDIIEKRKKIINALISCLIAIAVGRLLTRVLPFTIRPVLNPDLTDLYPFHAVADNLNSNSSMPSDHAVLYLALVMGIYLISKKAGLLSLIYIFAVGLFPRVYLGLHYPMDIFVGGIVGVLITLIYSHLKINNKINQKILNFSTNYPGLFYVLFFILSYQIASMFISMRDMQHYIVTTIKQFF